MPDRDTLCFGFAVNQDASFISYSCARYHLPYIDFKFFDIQEFEKRLFHRKNASGLQSLIEQYGEGAFTYHRSEDDALRTREVFKHRVKNLGQTVEQIWNRYPECINDTRTLNAHILEQKKARLAKQRRILRMNNFYSLPSPNANINCYSKLLWGKKFFFTTKVLKNQKCRDILFQKRDRFFKKGGILVKDYPDAGYKYKNPQNISDWNKSVTISTKISSILFYQPVIIIFLSNIFIFFADKKFFSAIEHYSVCFKNRNVFCVYNTANVNPYKTSVT